MATETLHVPETHLREFIAIVRAGLRAKPRVTPEVREVLESWCREESAYLKWLAREED